MSKKRDIYNEMDSEENDNYAEGYPSYYEEEDIEEPDNMDNTSEQTYGGGEYLDDEAEEDPYYDERGGEAYEPYFDPYDPRFQQYLLKNGYINYRGGREDDIDFDFSSPSASSSSSSSSESSDSPSEDSSDSSSEEKDRRRKPRKTMRSRTKTTQRKKAPKKTYAKKKTKK